MCDPCLAGELPSLWAEPTPPETATFDYLTDTEFKMQIEVIVEGFTPLRDGITKGTGADGEALERARKADRPGLLHTTGCNGAVKEIARNAVPTFGLLGLTGPA